MDLKKNHPLGLKGILFTYSFKAILRSIPFLGAFIASLSIIVLVFLFKKDSLAILKFWTDLNLSVFPNLLGFSLGGYALIIGFGNVSLIENLTKSGSETEPSIFQKASGIFAFSLLLQVFVFLFSLLIKFCVELNVKISDQIWYNINNLVAFFIMVFFSIWCILLVPYFVSNVFTFGQLHHFYLMKERLKKEYKSEGKETPE